ncbi:hypothetical protein GTP46_28140 [Duganella sp. FT135W]|uniref:Uncharacterized protein n=1 Tax=Duganella flavida TaxID=2692175 RepID=A0A6L8KPP1_9BURK|nr:hypothetical protein [Duganella flavida]MYM26501.1 hypothetical protein [Duganella flavida]
MQKVLSQQAVEEDVQKVISSLGTVQTITAIELIHALQQKEHAPNMAPIISAFLSHASADLIARICLVPGASMEEVSNLIEPIVAFADGIGCSRTSTLDIELRRVFVPMDFPAQPRGAALSGANPKVALVSYGGKYYEPGTAPPEVLSRWEVAEDLAHQFVERCRITEKGKYAHLSQHEILQQYLHRLLQAGWGSDSDMRWVIRRTAVLLGWDIPDEAKETLLGESSQS